VVSSLSFALPQCKLVINSSVDAFRSWSLQDTHLVLDGQRVFDVLSLQWAQTSDTRMEGRAEYGDGSR
jgi:hypothetical protein